MKPDNAEGADGRLEVIVGQRRNVLLRVIETLNYIEGASDPDDACLRCAKRMIAEALDLPLDGFRLLTEPQPLRPLYMTPNSELRRVGAGEQNDE